MSKINKNLENEYIEELEKNEKKMNKFKVGDKVKLVSMKNEVIYYKKYLGKVFTIEKLFNATASFKEKTEENISPYLYNLQKVEENRFENGTNITETRFINNHFEDKFCGKIIKIEEPKYTTVYESKPNILDEAEKRYLRGIIRPFRNKIRGIAKKIDGFKEENFISMEVMNDIDINLPSFKKDTMYKGMKINKVYTLEELGL